jgi:hypothetical protein
MFSVQSLVFVSSDHSPVYSVRCPMTTASAQWPLPVSGVQCPVYSVRCTVSGVQCPVYSVRCTVSGVQCPMYSVQCPVSPTYSVQCPVSSVQCPVSGVPCPMSCDLCPVNSVHCPVSSVQYSITVNTVPPWIFCSRGGRGEGQEAERQPGMRRELPPRRGYPLWSKKNFIGGHHL